MSAPTVAVTVRAFDQGGNPLVGARVVAKLSAVETYQGFIVPEEVEAVTDAAGAAVLNLFPNALGVAGSTYRVRVWNPDTGAKAIDVMAVVPNSPCVLEQIIQAEPFPPVDASQQALSAAQGALAAVTTKALEASASSTAAAASAGTATTKAAEASTSASQALTSRQAAQDAATTATTQAGIAQTAASFSAGSATEAAARATSAQTSATQAAASATTSSTKAAEASASASTASTGAATATTKASEAAASALAAATSATTAATRASEASTSAASASTSAGTASTKAGEAAASATAASASATSASGSASSASTSATQAASSASTASTHATSAGTSAGSAASSAANAATSAANAGTSANQAGSSAAAASTSATQAATSATSAAGSATQAATSATTAQSAATSAQQALQTANMTPAGLSSALSPSTTANGVLFTNGTKQIVSTSELTFDGAGALRFGSNGELFVSSSQLSLTAANNSPIRWLIGPSVPLATEAMRLTSTGLGIGTSTPAYKLDVNGTLGVSGTVTLSGETANGIPYLNGSKVLTSGSALTFDGASFRIGNGSGIPLAEINGGSAGGALRGQRAGVYHWFLGDTAAALGGGTGLISFLYNNDPFIWQNSVGERMRLTSAGLAIGATVPQGALDVRGAAFVTGANGIRITDAVNGNGFETVPGATTNVLSFNRTTLAYLPIRWRAGVHSWEVDNAEQMRLTSTGLGIGTTSPQQKLDVVGGDGNGLQYRTATRTVGVGQFSGEAAVYWGSGTRLNFNSGGLTHATLDASGNLGIGTSSPGAKLTVALGNLRQVTAAVNSTSGYELFDSANGGNHIGSLTRSNNGINLSSFDYIAFTTAANSGIGSGSERMRLDASGNLGLGVTPSAWASGFKVFAIGGNNIWSTEASNTLYFTQNSYFDGAFKYQGSGLAATRQEMANGVFKWYTAPSGTAGSPISFTQAMTLDASGNLGLGAGPSPGVTHIDISNGGSYYGIGNGAQVAANLYFEGGTWRHRANSAAARLDVNYSSSGGTAWFTSPSATAGSPGTFTQTMTLTAGGNLLVGTTADVVGRLQVVGAGGIRVNEDGVGTKAVQLRSDFAGLGPAIQVTTSDPLLLITANTERARITPTGDFVQTVNPAAATLASNGTMTFSLASDTSLRVSVRGSDGVTRTATIALA